MTLEIAARLAVLLACAVAAGALYVRLARPRPGRTAGPPSGPRPIGGAVDVALVAFVVVAGGAALSGIGLGAGQGTGLAILRTAGIAVLAAAGMLALVPLPSRGRLGTPALVGLAWIGAGMALAAPLVLLVAAVVIIVLAVRVTERPAT